MPQPKRPSQGDAATESDNEDIFVLSLDTSKRRRVTTHPSRDFSPQWTPDGARIAFASPRGDSSRLVGREYGSEIYAEELAVLDVVSGGRLDVGIGRGGTLQDYQTFQSERGDSRARVEEGIALMRHAWSGAPFDFQGHFHSAERLHVRPRPAQRPHPPLYIAANSEDSVLSAARLGLPTLSSFFVPIEELQRRHRLYRELSLAAGRSEADVDALERQAWGMRVVHVAPDHEEALRATEAAFMGYQRKMSVLRSEATGGTVPGSFDRSLLRLRAFRDYLDDGWALIGTPDEVRDGLQKYLDATGYQHVLLLMALPGLETSLALRSMRLFAEQMAPAMAPASGRVATGP
jgi:alkanesulfonate monooxygenase SsuD/methylene tetrahydromethanopterin reductase-like flavin-dependent oxidoreductase (luciferase family)